MLQKGKLEGGGKEKKREGEIRDDWFLHNNPGMSLIISFNYFIFIFILLNCQYFFLFLHPFVFSLSPPLTFQRNSEFNIFTFAISPTSSINSRERCSLVSPLNLFVLFVKIKKERKKTGGKKENKIK